MTNESISEIRAFNRFYTTILGILDKNYLNSGLTLTEVRILFELNQSPAGRLARELIEILQIDKGYLSRIVKILEKDKLIVKKQQVSDQRAYNLILSPAGKSFFRKLDKASEAQISGMLLALTPVEIGKLTSHMRGIQNLLRKGKRED